jgi:sodium transport system ATP-binding protein
MIVVSDLRKTFHDRSRGAVHAVDGVSFRVDAGEVYGLLGPNGAGKTTTLRILATLTEPDGGRVEVAGVDRVKDPLAARQKLAYVAAESGLPERLSAREVVRLFAGVQGVKDGRRRADELLERLGATKFADTPCGELSTGMKRRVVLARALVHDPSVLLLDEPTDGLDVPGRREVLQLIREQAALGRAVVLSSHIMGEVERVVTRLGVVGRGQMLAEGTLDEVRRAANADNLDDAFMALVGDA